MRALAPLRSPWTWVAAVAIALSLPAYSFLFAYQWWSSDTLVRLALAGAALLCTPVGLLLGLVVHSATAQRAGRWAAVPVAANLLAVVIVFLTAFPTTRLGERLDFWAGLPFRTDIVQQVEHTGGDPLPFAVGILGHPYEVLAAHGTDGQLQILFLPIVGQWLYKWGYLYRADDVPFTSDVNAYGTGGSPPWDPWPDFRTQQGFDIMPHYKVTGHWYVVYVWPGSTDSRFPAGSY